MVWPTASGSLTRARVWAHDQFVTPSVLDASVLDASWLLPRAVHVSGLGARPALGVLARPRLTKLRVDSFTPAALAQAPGSEIPSRGVAEQHVLRIPLKPGKKQRVLDAIADQQSRPDELAESYGPGERETIMFIAGDVGAEALYIYRRGDALISAGAQLMLSKLPINRDWLRALLDATEFERAETLPVAFRWPPE